MSRSRTSPDQRLARADRKRRRSERLAFARRLWSGTPRKPINALTHDLPGGRRLWIGYGSSGRPTARVDRLDRHLGLARRADGVVFSESTAPDAGGLRLTLVGSDAALDAPPGEAGDFVVPAGLLGGLGGSFRVLVRSRQGREVFVAADPARRHLLVAGTALELKADGHGDLWLHVRTSGRPAQVSVDDAGLISVEALGDPFGAVRLVSPAQSLQVLIPSADDGRFAARLGELALFDQPAPLRLGTWVLQAAAADAPERFVDVAPADGRVHPTIEVTDPTAGVRYLADVTPGRVTVTVRDQLRNEERHRRFRSRMYADIQVAAQGRRTREVVLYECYNGRQVSCHPRRVNEALREALPDWQHLWTISPGRTYPPPDTGAVVRWSREWYEALTNSRLFVTNCSLESGFVRRDDQLVVQTWHGTPLKRLGLDMLSLDHFSPTYRRDMINQGQQWSLLLSPSAYCSEIFPRCFAYDGELVEVGSPRNDRLVNLPDAPEIERIRRAVGVAPGARVVLYAPTWRDDRKTADGWGHVEELDIAALAASVSAACGEPVNVLYRAHSYIETLDASLDGGGVINVSDYPDIADLYLITDLLVTDYSSVMFDFACLGRPMVFHCPDMERYASELRGMYVDFVATAPGPITTDAAGLVDAIAAGLVDGGPQPSAAAFRERFTSWEQGDATERLVLRILAGLA